MTPILTRRHFLRSALAAPAIVAASSIMPVKLFSLEAAVPPMVRPSPSLLLPCNITWVSTAANRLPFFPVGTLVNLPTKWH